jgi:pilus assembly protein CpaB
MFPSITRLLIRLDRWPRRLAALTCLVLAAASAVLAHRATPADARPGAANQRVVVASHDLGAARTLTARDLSIAAWPADIVPSGTVIRPAALVGRRLAGPVHRGEAVTTARLVGGGLTAGLRPGQVAVTIRADSGVAGLVHAGDHVDILAGPPLDAVRSDAVPSDAAAEPAATGPAAAQVAAAVVVLAVLPAADPLGGGTQLIVATDRGTALRIVAVQGRHGLAVVLDPP